MKISPLLRCLFVMFLLTRYSGAQAQTVPLQIKTLANAQIKTAVAAVKAGKKATALVVTPIANGSSFCIHESGIFATNAHVVEGYNRVKIVVYPGENNQQTLTMRVSHCDVDNDLAVLVADPPLRTQAPDLAPLTVLPLGDSNALFETMPVAVFGFPLGIEMALAETEMPSVTVTTGRVTALRKLQGQLKQVQLDAAVNPGNSGGPVVNEQGEVVGILFAGIDGAQGLNFAIPIASLSHLLTTPEIRFDPPPTPWLKRTESTNWTIQIVPFTAFNSRVIARSSYDLEVAIGGDEDWRSLKTERVSAEGAAIPEFRATGPLFLPGEFDLLPPDYKLTLSQNSRVVEVREGTFEVTGAPAARGGKPRTRVPADGASPTPTVPSGPLVQNPANGHFYQYVIRVNNIMWENARKAAEKMTFNGWRGHMVSITSVDEEKFILEKVLVKGPQKNRKAWIGGKQGENAKSATESWLWTTGEPWNYTNWYKGEPNNTDNKGYLQFNTNGEWNDSKPTNRTTDYIVEFEATNGGPDRATP